RDIKPDNVMVLVRAGRLYPKLLDLGIAKGVAAPLADASDLPAATEGDEPPEGTLGAASVGGAILDSGPSDGQVLTRPGAVMGSAPSMAPEQWRAAAAATERSDVYALGVVAFEALTGRVPFGDTLVERMAQAPVPPLGPGFPPALDAVLMRAMAR